MYVQDAPSSSVGPSGFRSSSGAGADRPVWAVPAGGRLALLDSLRLDMPTPQQSMAFRGRFPPTPKAKRAVLVGHTGGFRPSGWSVRLRCLFCRPAKAIPTRPMDTHLGRPGPVGPTPRSNAPGIHGQLKDRRTAATRARRHHAALAHPGSSPSHSISRASTALSAWRRGSATTPRSKRSMTRGFT